MKKSIKLTGVFGFSLLLAGCGNGIQEALDTTSEIETQEQTVIEQLNSVSQQELSLQEAFETTLAEDEDLSSFADGSSAVFENIGLREESVGTISEANDALKEAHTLLTENESTDLPEQEVTDLSNDVESLTASLDSYITHYEQVLADQETFFSSLADESATYDTLTSGLQTLGEQDVETTDFMLQLDGLLSELQSSRSTAQETLNALNEEN